MKREPGQTSIPPAAPVRWTVTSRRTRERLGVVVAQTWFAARRRAMAEFQVEMGDIDVELENGRDALR